MENESRDTQIRMDLLCVRLSTALDVIETEILGATNHHSKRVAQLCAMMGRHAGFDRGRLTALSVCALFHDSALTEYILSERMGANERESFKEHCINGERNALQLPFNTDVTGIVLNHHERPDGKGLFGKAAGDILLESAFISLVDRLDVSRSLATYSVNELPELRAQITAMKNREAHPDAVDALLDALDENVLEQLKHVDDSLDSAGAIPAWRADVTGEFSTKLGSMIAQVIDYKSEFTRIHSTEIVKKAVALARALGAGEAELAKIYLAAALHDLGKIKTPIGILEKESTLDAREMAIMREHVRTTWEWLHDVPGLEEIAYWAASHHEKLDGSGYPFGRKAPELDRNARLLAVVDMYQGISEPRPYHAARTHAETMRILSSEARNGKIDENIVEAAGALF